MTSFIIGLIVGGIFGMLIACVLVMSGRSEEE